MLNTVRIHPLQSLLTILVVALFSMPALAEMELLLFPEIRFEQQRDKSTINTETPSLDIFGTTRWEQLRLLGEFTLTDDGIKAERLKLGYEFSAQTILWGGRIHNPLGYWNTQYHHSNYLQTSISRPEIARYGDEGGLFSSHVIGIMLETSQLKNNSAFNYSLLLSSGSELRAGNNAVLHSVDLLDIRSGNHKTNITSRFTYHPDSTSDNQIGFFANYVEIPIRNSTYDSVELTTVGLFSNWQFTSIILTSALYLVKDELYNNTTKLNQNFASGYVQANYLANELWTPYARFEQTNNSNSDQYLSLMNNFIPERHVFGLRWDFTSRQAFKLEYTQNYGRNITFSQILLNWSAVYP